MLAAKKFHLVTRIEVSVLVRHKRCEWTFCLGLLKCLLGERRDAVFEHILRKRQRFWVMERGGAPPLFHVAG